MAGFTKLFSSIVDSTIWREDLHIKVVWVTMLAKADKFGVVACSLPGLADASRVTILQCQEALEKLSGPDPFSRTKDFEGRRIIETDGGWIILNHTKYRKLQDEEERRIATADRVREFRNRQKSKDVTNVTNVTPSNAIAEADTEAETTTTTAAPSASLRSKGRVRLSLIRTQEDQQAFETLWLEWPREREGKPARGEKPKAEACFQEIIKSGEVSSQELLSAGRLYLAEDERVKAGFPKMVSSFFALKDGFWRSCVRTLRQRMASNMEAV